MSANTKKEKSTKKKKYRALRIIGRVFITIVLFLFILLLFIRSEWGQNLIVDKATSYVSDKTGTRVEIDRIFISFDGDIVVEELFLDTPLNDTLIYSEYLELDMPLWPIIKGDGIGLEELESRGLKATITRKDTISGFNFQFLIDAFATDQTAPTTPQDTTAQPTNFILGDLQIDNADVTYIDGVTGIDSHFVVGSLYLSMEDTDLESLHFSANEGIIENTTIAYKQQPIPTDPDAEDSPLPKFAIENLEIKNVSGFYDQVETGLLLDFKIPDFRAQIPAMDLSTSTFNIKKIAVNEGFVGVQLNNGTSDDSGENTSSQTTGLWPPYTINVGKIDIANFQFKYTTNGAQVETDVFDPNAVSLRNIQVDTQNFFLKNEEMGIDINHISLAESAGLLLKSLSGNLNVSDRNFTGNNLIVHLNNNKLKGGFNADYTSLDALVSSPEKSKINAAISTLQVDLKDIFAFQPTLRNNEYLASLSKNLIKGSFNLNGSLAALAINELQIQWSKTRINAIGELTNVLDTERVALRLPNYSVSSDRSDLIEFIDEQELSVQLPSEFLLRGNLRGNTSGFVTNSTLNTSQGNVSIDGNLKLEDPLSFDTSIQVANYDLGNLLQNDQIGNLTVNMDARGSGTSMNTLDALVKVTVDSFAYNNYKIKDLPIEGVVTNGRGTLNSSYKDPYINIELASKIKLDTVAPEIRALVDIKGADLMALGLMKRDIRTGAKIDAFFKGNASSYNASATINDGVIVYDNNTYLLGSLETRARIRPDTTTVSLKNKIVDMNLESNTDPAGFATALQEHIYSYFYRDTQITDTLSKPVIMKMRGKIAQTPLLNEVFLVNVKDLDTINVSLDFNQTQRKLTASVQAPHINYSGNEIDSLSFLIDTSAERFDFDLGFNAINSGPIAIGRTSIKGRQENNELNLDFLAFDEKEKLIHINAGITGSSERLRFHIYEDEIIFNRKLWTAPSTNEIILTEEGLAFNDFRFKRNSQEVNFSDAIPSISKDHFGVEFVNFKLQELLSYLNPNEQLATGHLNGELVIEDPLGNFGLLADLDVSKLELLDVDMGHLDLNAKALGGNEYDFSVDLSGGAANLEIVGDYTTSQNDAVFNMDLAITKFEMDALEGLSQGQIVDGSGNLSGDFTINGTLAEPDYEGEIRFNQASFKIAAFNTAFRFPQEAISVDTDEISMREFHVKDENGNVLSVSGEIGTTSFLNPTFNLEVDAQNFQALNATEEDNDLIYGKAIISANATIKGDLEIPIVDIEGTVNSETNVTYVMPASTANIESREGIVTFVNRENPDAILTSTEDEVATITGFDIKTLIKVMDGAKVTIVLDESTGDNVQVTGKGEFVFTMLPNGRMTLTGGYEMTDGQYSMNLYNLVNRTFDIASGSTISWSGNPFDAQLDVRAIYSLETSASPLMAPTSSNEDPTAQGRYRQVLPFLVYLNVDGELMSPKLTFGLDMPEDNQGAIGGQVYGRVQQVNTQEGELNRQVFSLLVLNRFYPDPGSDGSRGGFANIARDNLNNALSDQLNVFSDKLLGKTGVELNFGLDSYTDYQGETPQERTQLDIAAQKKLFDDRLVVSVGSAVDVEGDSPNGESTPIIGNVSLEYILTNDGRYRIKGFRRNEFENVIDGQTIASGIGIIFTQEFNKFSELWDAILRSKTKQLKEENKIENEDKDQNEDQDEDGKI